MHACSPIIEVGPFVYREELEFIANTLIFVLTGVIIAGNIYQSEHSVGATIQIQARDYGYAFLLWVVLIVSHGHWAVTVCMSMPSMPSMWVAC